MLESLRIRNLALVTDLTLELGPGYNAISGETGAGKSILIVEDVDDALFLMAQLLELSGAEVHQASNGREALALKKVREIKSLGGATLVEVDGGVSAKSAPDFLEAGADVIVAGGALFGGEDPSVAINALRGA